MGQAALLLDSIATQQLSFKFKRFKIISMGSFSRVEGIELADKSTYELYGSNDIAGLLFLNRRLDFGLTAFLDLIQQLGGIIKLRIDFAESKDRSSFRLPYRIKKEYIGDISVKFQTAEQWTKALKYMIINLKRLQSFYCSSLN